MVKPESSTEISVSVNTILSKDAFKDTEYLRKALDAALERIQNQLKDENKSKFSCEREFIQTVTKEVLDGVRASSGTKRAKSELLDVAFNHSLFQENAFRKQRSNIQLLKDIFILPISDAQKQFLAAQAEYPRVDVDFLP